MRERGASGLSFVEAGDGGVLIALSLRGGLTSSLTGAGGHRISCTSCTAWERRFAGRLWRGLIERSGACCCSVSSTGVGAVETGVGDSDAPRAVTARMAGCIGRWPVGMSGESGPGVKLWESGELHVAN